MQLHSHVRKSRHTLQQWDETKRSGKSNVSGRGSYEHRSEKRGNQQSIYKGTSDLQQAESVLVQNRMLV